MRWLWPGLSTFLLATAVSAEPTWSLESAWSAHQVFLPSGAESGIAAWTSVSGWTEPGFWLGVGAGVDGEVTGTGAFGALQPRGQARAGVQLPFEGWTLVVPWAGGSAGWAWGSRSPGLRWSVDGGLDAEFRLTGIHYLVLGAGYRSDGAVEVSLAFRDRTTWRLPPPPPKPRIINGPRPIKTGPRAKATAQPFPRPAKVSGVGFVVTPEVFSPDGDGEGDELQVAIQVDPGVVGWEWTVVAPGNQIFARRSGQGVPPAMITWDGRSDGGELVSSATDYQIDLSVTDTAGRTYGRRQTITTDVLLLRVGAQYLIRLPSINFVANSPGLSGPPPAAANPGAGQLVVTLQDQNADVLRRLAEILQRFPQYSITIVGHANLVSWADPAKAAEEDRKESRPLSLQRAQSVKDALVKRGLDPKRIKVEGAGGSKPLFPFGDLPNAWKNRRVDVVLDKTPTAR